MAGKAGSNAMLAADGGETPRHMPRRKTFRLVAIEVDRACHRAHMLNLSTGGACLHARLTLRAWQTIGVDLDGRMLPARVSWTAGDRCGVRFLEPLTVEEVDALLDG